MLSKVNGSIGSGAATTQYHTRTRQGGANKYIYLVIWRLTPRMRSPRTRCTLRMRSCSPRATGSQLATTVRWCLCLFFVGHVATPLQPEAWRQALAKHPNPAWVAALVQGIQQGFRIGLQEHPQCRPRLTNTPSAREHSEVVDQFVRAQVSQGYMAGPFPVQDCTNVIISGIAVIPKKTPGKWRVIVDMSSPQNASVNDYLHRELMHVTYASIEDAAHLMHHLGHNCQLAKLDIKEAYRIIPVHPEDRVFQEICWKDAVYVDCQLPFGLASAPAIFSAVSQALEWILRQRGVRAVIHYMDDFLLLGTPGTPECSQALEITTSTCKELGIPLAETNRRPYHCPILFRHSPECSHNVGITASRQANQASGHGEGPGRGKSGQG